MVQSLAAWFFGALGGGAPPRIQRDAPRAPRRAVGARQRGEVYDGATSRPGAVLRVGIAITDVSMMWIIPTNVLLGLAGFKPGGGHPLQAGDHHSAMPSDPNPDRSPYCALHWIGPHPLGEFPLEHKRSTLRSCSPISSSESYGSVSTPRSRSPGRAPPRLDAPGLRPGPMRSAPTGGTPRPRTFAEPLIDFGRCSWGC
jgi:hypothetical protein